MNGSTTPGNSATLSSMGAKLLPYKHPINIAFASNGVAIAIGEQTYVATNIPDAMDALHDILTEKWAQYEIATK